MKLPKRYVVQDQNGDNEDQKDDGRNQLRGDAAIGCFDE